MNDKKNVYQSVVRSCDNKINILSKEAGWQLSTNHDQCTCKSYFQLKNACAITWELPINAFDWQNNAKLPETSRLFAK